MSHKWGLDGKSTLKVIDWGLAEYYIPNRDYHVRVASRYFKPPELLVGYPFYHYSIDIWSLGALMAGIIFKKEPFFKGNDNDDQLVKIVKVLGTDSLEKYLRKYNVTLRPEFDNLIGNFSLKPWSKFVTNENEQFATQQAIDLVDKMLVMDHWERITTVDAMKHNYFDEVRDSVKAEENMN